MSFGRHRQRQGRNAGQVHGQRAACHQEIVGVPEQWGKDGQSRQGQQVDPFEHGLHARTPQRLRCSCRRQETWSDASRPSCRRPSTSAPMASGAGLGQHPIRGPGFGQEKEAAGERDRLPLGHVDLHDIPAGGGEGPVDGGVDPRVGLQPHASHPPRGRSSGGESGLEQPHAHLKATDVAGHGPTVSKLGDNGQTPSDGDPAPRRLQSGRSATGGRDRNRATRIGCRRPRRLPPVATATADPLDEPPGTRAGREG